MMGEFGGLPNLSESEQDEENSPPVKKKRVAVYITYEKKKEFDNLQSAAELYQIGWFCIVSTEGDFFSVFNNFLNNLLTFFTKIIATAKRACAES